MRKVITNSMRTCFLDCPYRFFLEYVRRLTPILSADYFRWGSLIHLCKECEETGRTVDDAIEATRKEAEERPASARELSELEEMCILAPRALGGHLLKWGEEDKNYEDLGVETKFELPLPCGWIFKGKMDKPIRDIRDGRIMLLERKTAAQINDLFWENKELDSQPKGYLLACQRALGIDTRRVLYDVFGKPGIRLKKGETRAAFVKRQGDVYLLKHKELFQRRIVTYTQPEIDEYFFDLDQVAMDMEHHLAEALWPKHHPGNRFGRCAFEAVCKRGDESKFYVRDEKCLNPELER